jgi:hypothetical protein
MTIAVFCFLATSILQAATVDDAPKTEWAKTFGGTDTDEGYFVQQTTDEGFVIVGETSSYGHGDGDVWLIKTNATGVEQWNKTFGGSASEYARAIQQTDDNGYIIVGKTSSYGKGGDIWLIKTNTTGVEQWNRSYGGASYEWATSVQQTSDGGYILVGVTNSYGAGGGDVWVIKTNQAGIEQWNKTYGGKQYDVGHTIIQTNDDGYAIVGATQSFGSGSDDIWLIKTDATGIEQWNTTYGGIEFDAGWSIQQTNDNGYAIVGETASYGLGQGDVWLIKTDMTGSEQWNGTYGGIYRDEGYSVRQTNDGGYIIAGVTSSYEVERRDALLIKTNAAGFEQWNITYGGIGYDCVWSVQQTSDSGYVITGYTDSYGAGDDDVFLVKYSEQKENGGKNNSSNNTPGFGLIFPIIAITLIVLWRRKRIS